MAVAGEVVFEPDTREWLCANGLGGYASGTVCGANTRRYHGLLVAALNPPTQRTVLLARIDETVSLDAERYELAVNFWSSGAVAPRGDRRLLSFSAEPVPTWLYQVGRARLVKQVAALPGRNAVAIGYQLEEGPAVGLELRLLANHRDYHGDTHGHPDWRFRQRLEPDGLEVSAWDGATPWFLRWRGAAEYRPIESWYWGYHYPEEAARGLAPGEDLYCLGELRGVLEAGQSLELVAGLEPLEPPGLPAVIGQIEVRRERLLIQSGLPPEADAAALVQAADQFVVQRASTGGPTVIAGYHWFADWGRDTMIALPGLTLATRRFEDAAGILQTFARYVDRGLLPNRFPDYAGEPPEYNTVDATLWWFHALASYYRASGDLELPREQLPILAEVVEWHLRGTRHGIKADPADGLLAAGEPGLQLTWMDARVDGWVVTPRIGKPIEVNALWLNALEVLAELGPLAGLEGNRYRGLAAQARAGLQRFWLEQQGYLADVIEPDGRLDASLRPNQLIALALPRPAFSREIGARVLAAVDRDLLTPYGPRSLAPADPSFQPYYRGDSRSRDSAYHQGAIWPWLLGPYADACRYVYGDTPATRQRLRALLKPLLAHLRAQACLGSVSEIFEAVEPFEPRGCVAQAWSVAELLRIYAGVQQAVGDREEPTAAAIPVAPRRR